MNVLSLFDGISCGRVALDRAGIKYDKYYASEIDTNAIAIAMKNYPDTIQKGDITEWKEWNLQDIQLIIGGSPCTGFSQSGQLKNFKDPQSKLFFDYVDIVNHYKPKYFLLENVSMKQEWQDIISGHLGIKPICINSLLVSAQYRKRLYWTNIPDITQPEDRKLCLKDIMEDFTDGVYDATKKVADKYDMTDRIKAKPKHHRDNHKDKSKEGAQKKIDNPMGQPLTYKKAHGNMREPSDKSKTLTTGGHNISNTGSTNIVIQKINEDGTGGYVRMPTPIECERLQTLPDKFTALGRNTDTDELFDMKDNIRYKVLGNGWTVEIIAHIFKHMLKENVMKTDNTKRNSKVPMDETPDLGLNFSNTIEIERKKIVQRAEILLKYEERQKSLMADLNQQMLDELANIGMEHKCITTKNVPVVKEKKKRNVPDRIDEKDLPPGKKIIDTDKVAEMLGIDTHAVTVLVGNNKLTGYMVNGKKKRQFIEDEIIKYMKENNITKGTDNDKAE